MYRVVWGMIAWGACRNGSIPPQQQTSLPCQPVVHQSTGALTTTYFEQYRFVGGSHDGKRVAVERGNIGPGAGVPVIALMVVEAAAPKAAYMQSYFVHDGTADQLPTLMNSALADHGADVGSNGVTVGKDSPQPIAWCTDRSGKIHTASGHTLELLVDHAACPNDPARHSLTWKLCATGGACISRTHTGCIDGKASLLDLYRAGTYTWAVVDEAIEPMQDVTLHSPTVAGGVM